MEDWETSADKMKNIPTEKQSNKTLDFSGDCFRGIFSEKLHFKKSAEIFEWCRSGRFFSKCLLLSDQTV